MMLSMFPKYSITFCLTFPLPNKNISASMLPAPLVNSISSFGFLIPFCLPETRLCIFHAQAKKIKFKLLSK